MATKFKIESNVTILFQIEEKNRVRGYPIQFGYPYYDDVLEVALEHDIKYLLPFLAQHYYLN